MEGEGSTAVGGGEEGGITRRRPRKARFTLSAENAAKEAGLGDDKRRKERERQGERDRAVVVVYGLSPGKEYEIELRVVGMFGEGGDGIGKLVPHRSSILTEYSVKCGLDPAVAIA